MKKILFFFMITLIGIQSLHAQKTITTTQILESFKTHYDQAAVNATLADFSIGNIDMSNASAEIVVNKNNETSRYATAPIYVGTNLNAVLLGLYGTNGSMQYWIVQVTGNGNDALITYYRPGEGKETVVQIINKILTKIDDYSLPNNLGNLSGKLLAAAGSCVGNVYHGCQAACTGGCATSCAFWNDWAGGLCNKAMWIGAAAQCAGLPSPGGSCGGF